MKDDESQHLNQIPGKSSEKLLPTLSLAGAAAAAQPERDVGHHQPRRRRGLQVPRRGQGGGGGVLREGEGERGNEQQRQWQWRGGRWQVHRSWLVFVSFVVVFVSVSLSYDILTIRWLRGEQGEPRRASNSELNPDLSEEEQEEEQSVHPIGQGQGEI